MKLLESFVHTPLAEAVGWALLHSFWEGAILSATLAAVLFAIRSPRARYAAACLAMLLTLAAFILTLTRMMPAGVHGLQNLRQPAFSVWSVETGAERPRGWDLSLAAAAPWLAPFWIVGVSLFYLRRVAGCISVRRLRHRGVCCASDRWQKELVRLSAQLRLSRPALLLESCLADVPIVLGHFRPLILMPLGLLAGLPAAHIEAILLHELTHIRRSDYLVNVLQRLVESLLFYHPAVWWISRVMCAERENCCDDAAVAISGNAREYAVALAALEQNRWSGRQPAIAATGGSLVKRIRRLLYPKGPNGAWTLFFAALIFIGTAAVALAAWQSEPSEPNSPAAQRQTYQAVLSRYSKWLNEDVVYIINDEERSAFEKLTTHEERDKFIEQFWLRRDPTPDTPPNEFKDEHYRRIAYANGHFRTASGKPGWQTDRGHMYIVYGPPDQIDSHPSGTSNNPHPIEVWMYRHLEGVGDNLYLTFIAQTARSDYHLAPGNVR